ncbi:MAG: right-handed parallel beta-helix repeat-containing protein [Clostridia bacterium]|nr:right-handed parallel beta-helix repeat-containing protein [Clostridia bacterium]
MEKKDIRVSDTIPQRPASFDDAVERTLASVTKKEQQKETPVRTWKTDSASTRKRGSKRSVLDIVAIAAIFVVCVVAIGTVIGVRAHLNRTGPAAEQPTPPVNMSNTVYVSTVDELLAALAPDTRIVLSDGTYNLTEASDYGTEGGQYYTWEDRSDNWFREPEENSFELCLKDLENCCITGSRNAEIVTVPRTAAVLSARNCAGLVLSGFTAGHTVMADPCEGEVIRLVECADAWVEDCSLYGCGTWGVSAVDCDNLTVTGSDIHECSSGGVSFVRCRNTLISNCTLRNCGYRDNAFSIVYIYDCKDLRITGCDVYENRTDVLFNLYGDDVKNGMDDVLILGTSVHDNEVLDQGFYSYTAKGPVVAGCEFKNNTGVLLSDEQCVFDRDGNRLYESDLLAMQLDRTLGAELEAFPTLEPRPSEDPNALVPAIRVNGEMYVITEFETVAEPDESEIIGYITSVVPISEWPTEDGQANFCEVGTPYAVTQDGLFVLYDNEWRLFEAEEFGDPDAEFCTFFDGCLHYAPFVNWVWSDHDDGLAADGMTFLWKMEEVKDKIPTIYNPGMLTVTAGDGVNLEPKVNIYDAALNTVAFGADISTVCTLDPGTYYVSQRVSRRETDSTSGYECVVRVVIGETAEQPTPEPVEEPPMEESSAIPSTFRFWDYDEQNGYSEAPTEGVMFVCDFDGDGTEEEIRYAQHGSKVTISVGKKSIDVAFGAGLEHAILLDLDPASARLNLLLVYNTGSEDYETAELHMENGRFVRGPVIWAYCNYDGETLRGAATQTDILGTKVGGRTYHGEDLTPDSEWFDCDVIPDDIPTARDRESLIENGKLLHLIRDLPCTIDGQDAVIPAGTYIYMTRWHESGTLAEIRTEDGTITALVTVQEADENDPDLYGYLIDGVMQFEYFDNIFFAD